MSFADVVAWLPVTAAAAGLVGCITLRDLLHGQGARRPSSLPGLNQSTGSTDPATEPDAATTAYAIQAQRSQWMALASVTVMMTVSVRAVAWEIEKYTVPGAAWIIGMLLAVSAGMHAADGVFCSLNLHHRGRRLTGQLITLNRLLTAGCAVMIVAPWVWQPPRPRGPELDQFIAYYQPTLASFISTCAMALYIVVATSIIGVPSWRAARDEPDRDVRTSLRIVAVAELAAVVTIVVPQLLQSYSWYRGQPVWDARQEAVVLLAGLMISSTLSTLGPAWAPLRSSHQHRVNEFRAKLWRNDVIALRPAWRLLRQLNDRAYEAKADMVTAPNYAGLSLQHPRMIMGVMDMLVPLCDYLTPEGRAAAETLTGCGRSRRWSVQLTRLLSLALRPILVRLGGYFPERVERWWTELNVRAVTPFVAADAACARAAIAMLHNGSRPVEDTGRARTPIMTFEPRSNDETAAYLRLLAAAARDIDIVEAGTGATIAMTYSRAGR